MKLGKIILDNIKAVQFFFLNEFLLSDYLVLKGIKRKNKALCTLMTSTTYHHTL
jgi:hypothetical protein